MGNQLCAEKLAVKLRATIVGGILANVSLYEDVNYRLDCGHRGRGLGPWMVVVLEHVLERRSDTGNNHTGGHAVITLGFESDEALLFGGLRLVVSGYPHTQN